ncbi:MAG: 2-oxo acid dehydrogenase subunit E2 [Deltaproteobacteria bacterium]|nr:2-oxo acid dehydrogenase subunit E2 [Deltaproteobacteria bacterium]
MTFDFKLPDLGEGITEGEVVKWRIKEGDDVQEHQIVLEVETDKAIVEVPSPKKGKVVKLNKAEGDIVKVGETLVVIETLETAGLTAQEKKPDAGAVVGTLPAEEAVFATPKARTVAKETGLDLTALKGTGPGGIITEKDVRGASADAPVQAPLEKKTEDRYGVIERIPIKGVRKSIAKNLLSTLRNTAPVTGMEEADVTDLWDLRQREKKAAKDKGVHLTFMPFFMKAVQHALAVHPVLNGSVDEKTDEIIVKKYYNIGVAVDTLDGLMVSVVKDVEKKSILDLAVELQELSVKARERRITLDELKGSSFTISNYGSYGGAFATPIINYPDVAILGTGRITEKPWVKDGAIMIRKVLPLSLTFDHRVTDGGEAAKFLTRVVKYLEDPAMIFIESR